MYAAFVGVGCKGTFWASAAHENNNKEYQTSKTAILVSNCVIDNRCSTYWDVIQKGFVKRIWNYEKRKEREESVCV